MKQNYSALSGWMIPISRALEICNINFEEVMKVFKIDASTIKNQESRIAAEKFNQLLYYCNNKVENKNFSMIVAEQYHPNMFHALGYAMMSSNCLKDALARIKQYKRVVSNSCKLELKEIGNELHFEMEVFCYDDTHRPVLSCLSIETFLGTIIQFSREFLGYRLRPKKLMFSFPKRATNTQYLEDFFGCEIEFDADRSTLIFSLEETTAILLGSNPLISQVHLRLLDDFLSRIDKDDLIHVIRNKIYQTLPLGAPSQTEIAQQLCMSLRNLQRKLKSKGSSYKEILEQTRKQLAIEYIKQDHLSLSEMGYLVGFASIGNFNRAFKRWTGTTPGRYRKQSVVLKSTTLF